MARVRHAPPTATNATHRDHCSADAARYCRQQNQTQASCPTHATTTACKQHLVQIGVHELVLLFVVEHDAATADAETTPATRRQRTHHHSVSSHSSRRHAVNVNMHAHRVRFTENGDGQTREHPSPCPLAVARHACRVTGAVRIAPVLIHEHHQRHLPRRRSEHRHDVIEQPVVLRRCCGSIARHRLVSHATATVEWS